MKLPRHVHLSIEHQPHAVNYQSVEEWLARDGADLELEVGERARMIETGEVWVIQWYPDTPVGFCTVAAATLERALELASDPSIDATAEAPVDPVTVYARNPGLPTDGRRIPLLDRPGDGAPIGHVTADGDRLAVVVHDREVAKRLSAPKAEISIGYTVHGEPIEASEVPE